MEVAATSYARGNKLQRQDVERIMDKYSKKIQWCNDGNDAVLDLGSGAGDITNDFILPILPPGFKKLVGVDIAGDMVEVANKRYSNTRVTFEQWDMCGDIDVLLRTHPEGFDHIFSSFALHWLPKPELAIKNIYNLLRPNGDCFLNFPAYSDYTDIEDIVLAMPKWSKIIPNPKRMPMPYRHCKDLIRFVGEQLRLAGFETYSVDAYDSSYTFNSLEITKRSIAGVNANLTPLTSAHKDEYFLDFLNIAAKMGLADLTNYPIDVQYTINTKILVAYAQKKF